MKQLPTRISKSGTTHQSATVSGQREMLRELRNKVNEIIDYLDDQADRDETHPSPQIGHQDWDSEIGLAVLKDDGPLYSFVQYCTDHPQLRFWQALNAWSRRTVLLSQVGPYIDEHVPGVTVERFVDQLEDPFYWKGRGKEDR